MCIDGTNLTFWLKCAVILQEVHSRDSLNMLIDKLQGPATPTQISTASTTKILEALICQYEMSACHVMEYMYINGGPYRIYFSYNPVWKSARVRD